MPYYTPIEVLDKPLVAGYSSTKYGVFTKTATFRLQGKRALSS
jgi:hypothetical protein